MTPEQLRTLFEYHDDITAKVRQCADELPDDLYFKPLDYSIGGIHHQLVHMMGAEQIWFSRLQGQSPTAIVSPASIPTRDALTVAWGAVKAQQWGYLNTVTAEALAENRHYTSTEGEPFVSPTWGILLHVINHATDHRAQILAMIHTLGGRTIPQDFITYIR
ncbi:MAG: DinB family protein [Phototrophicaceae bacterium]|jgi:uncharacterized damage-inducible protein DinB